MYRLEIPDTLVESLPLRACGAWERRLRGDVARWCRENLEGWWRLVVRGPRDALLVCGEMADAALFRLWWL